MIRFLAALIGIFFFVPSVQATTIMVHTDPSFEFGATDLYANAYQYSTQEEALAAANLFLSDGGAAHGWGTGAFGGSSGFQTHYLFFAYDQSSHPGETRAVRLMSFGNQFEDERTGWIASAGIAWTYDNHFNDQFLLVSDQYESPVVPEPTTGLLLGLGLVGLSVKRRFAV